eukprot:SM000048S16522  [mRNA]  locus=s48:138148:139875:- [translate_table: standard]
MVETGLRRARQAAAPPLVAVDKPGSPVGGGGEGCGGGGGGGGAEGDEVLLNKVPPEWFGGSSPLEYELAANAPERRREVATQEQHGGPPSEAAPAVARLSLRWQAVGAAVVVYGTAAAAPNGAASASIGRVHRVSLNLADYLQGGGGGSTGGGGEGGSGIQLGELYRNLRRLWREVKDGLSLPLLANASRALGLAWPICFLDLPTDVKEIVSSRAIKVPSAALAGCRARLRQRHRKRLIGGCSDVQVLSKLSARDLAAVGGASAELHYLAADEELWQRLVLRDFGEFHGTQPGRGWRATYAREASRRREQMRMVRLERYAVEELWQSSMGIQPQRRWQPPVRHFQPPGIIGGDYDRFPAMGDSFLAMPGSSSGLRYDGWPEHGSGALPPGDGSFNVGWRSRAEAGAHDLLLNVAPGLQQPRRSSSFSRPSPPAAGGRGSRSDGLMRDY